MPTVEDYFDDDTDVPLPSSSSRHLPNTGGQGALLEEISTDDPDVPDLDYNLLAEQGRGIFGEGTKAPPPVASGGSRDKGKLAVRDDPGDMRPSGMGGAGGMNANSPMGGFMGDMMRLQQAEDERMERMRQQFGNATLTKDMEAYKGWNSIYPIYFDAKVSVSTGRRVKRESAIWWPQARHIAQACRSLGLPSVLEPDKTHPADWENPGRVKVQFERDGRYMNPIIKNRTQLYRHLAAMIRQAEPTLVYKRNPKPSASQTETAAAGGTSKSTSSTAKSGSKGKEEVSRGKAGKSLNSQTSGSARRHPYGPTRPPRPTVVPPLDDRLPLHTPRAQTGVAVASVKRELETEKENKKKGISMGGGAGGGADGAEGKEGKEAKMPKMKRVVVRGKR